MNEAIAEEALAHAQLIDDIATGLRRRGLHLPVLVALEAGRPFAFIGGQLVWIMQPFLSLFIPSHKLDEAAHLLEDAAAVRALMQRLAQESA